MIALNDVHQAKARRPMADLYIDPPVERFGILEFQAYRRIIEVGYRAGQEALDRAGWRRLEVDRPRSAP